jgi:nitroreductase
MLKKIFLLFVGVVISFNAGANEIRKLPNPDKNADIMKLFENRKSSRDYSSSELNLQTLSDVLWSAFGINERGTRTIPTAKNEQNLKLYVVYDKSVWAYNAKENELVKVNDENVEQFIAKQDFVKDAPVNLIYTGSDKDYSYFHAGAAAQNVHLYAASKGLNTIVRGYIDKEELKNKLHLKTDEFVIINQVIGYPKG